MLSVAARPDANYRLISYPYYVADKKAGESTFFKHVDLSPGRYVETAGTQGSFSSPNSPYLSAASIGPGGLTIQGGVAIDNEIVKGGCTEVVKGFHKVMGTWWTEVEDRFTKKDMRAPYGLVTKIDSQVWTREGELKYGSFQPVPMEAGQI